LPSANPTSFIPTAVPTKLPTYFPSKSPSSTSLTTGPTKKNAGNVNTVGSGTNATSSTGASSVIDLGVLEDGFLTI